MSNKQKFNEILIYDESSNERESLSIEPRFGKFLLSVIGRNSLILDVGCGTGRYTSYMKDAGNDVYGIELVQSAAKHAHERGLSVIVGDSELTFPFHSGTFDRITCIEVIEHLLEPTVTLLEINRCLKKSGELFLSTPNAVWWAHRSLMLCGIPSFGHAPRYPVEVNMHIRHFSMKTLRQFLERYGFEIVRTQGTYTGFPGALSEYAPRYISIILNIINTVTRGFGFLAKNNIFPSLTSAGLVIHARKIRDLSLP